jgi:hypothetical protein
MKRMLGLCTVLALLVVLGSVLSAFGGPAPNSGDGVSDGSGYIVPPGPTGDGDPLGPNPSAGDGIPDGSDLSAPYGPFQG